MRQHTKVPVIRLTSGDYPCKSCGTLLIEGDRVKAYSSGVYGQDCCGRGGRKKKFKLTPEKLLSDRLRR